MPFSIYFEEFIFFGLGSEFFLFFHKIVLVRHVGFWGIYPTEP